MEIHYSFEENTIFVDLYIFISGNELEEDLEILEEASLQVCFLFNSDLIIYS